MDVGPCSCLLLRLEYILLTLRELWHRKLWVGLAIVVAAAAGLIVASRQYSVEQASADVLVDTPSSQVVDLGNGGQSAEVVPGIETLATRARLLGNLMASGSLKLAIAKSAGIKSEQLVVVPPPDSLDVEATPVATGGGSAGADATILTLTTDSTLPILYASAQAPSAETAERLATGAVEELKRYLGSVAATDQIPEARQLVVSEIGTRRAAPVARGPSTPIAVLAALLVASLGCAAIVGLPRLARSWREAGETAVEPPDSLGSDNGNGNGHLEAEPESDDARTGSEHAGAAPSHAGSG